jgi:hypothetical protein
MQLPLFLHVWEDNMRRVFALVIVVACVVGLLAMISPVAAQGTCYRVVNTVTNVTATRTFIITAAFFFYDGSSLTGSSVTAGPGQTVVASFEASLDTDQFDYGFFIDATDGGGVSDADIDFTIQLQGCGGGSSRPAGIYDGRLNPTNIASLVAVYRNTGSAGGLDIYLISPTNGQGTFGAQVTREQLTQARDDAKANQENTLVTIVGNASLYVLYPSEQCQLNSTYADGKPSVDVFSCLQ